MEYDWTAWVGKPVILFLPGQIVCGMVKEFADSRLLLAPCRVLADAALVTLDELSVDPRQIAAAAFSKPTDVNGPTLALRKLLDDLFDDGTKEYWLMS